MVTKNYREKQYWYSYSYQLLNLAPSVNTLVVAFSLDLIGRLSVGQVLQKICVIL